MRKTDASGPSPSVSSTVGASSARSAHRTPMAPSSGSWRTKRASLGSSIIGGHLDEPPPLKAKQPGPADAAQRRVHHQMVDWIERLAVGRGGARILLGEVGPDVAVRVVDGAHRLVAGKAAVEEHEVARAEVVRGAGVA